jgi:hypothetical protein
MEMILPHNNGIVTTEKASYYNTNFKVSYVEVHPLNKHKTVHENSRVACTAYRPTYTPDIYECQNSSKFQYSLDLTKEIRKISFELLISVI